MASDRRQHDLDLVRRLVGGEASAWERFVDEFSSAIYGAVVNTLRRNGSDTAHSNDIAQDVFVRLCKDDFRLLRQFDPKRAGLKTWLGVISSSVTIDFLRKQKAPNVPLDDVPEETNAVDPVTHDPVKIPDGLLSDRQAMILRMLYDEDMDAAEIGDLLGIDSQTVRSTHHKALVKLRKYFKDDAEE